MLCFALIYPDLPSVSERLFCPKLCHGKPKRGKIRQIDAVNRSKNVVGIVAVTTKKKIIIIISSFFEVNTCLQFHKNHSEMLV